MSVLSRQTTVAIFNDSTVVGLDQTRIRAIATYVETNSNHSVDVVLIDTAQLSNHLTFNATQFDYLVLTQAPLLPYTQLNVTRNYIQYLKDGGNLLLMGGKSPQLNVSLKDVAVNVMSDYEPYHIQNATVRGNLLQDSTKIPNVSGLSAIAWAFPHESLFYPFLEAYDQFGRVEGWVFSVLNNTNGSYEGGCWWLSGIETAEFYTSNAILQLITDIITGHFKVDDAEKVSRTLIANQRNYESTHSVLTEYSPVPVLRHHASDGFLRLSNDHKSIVYPDGKKFFMIGADYYRSLDNAPITPSLIESAFQKAAKTGLNSFRMFGYCKIFEEVPDVLQATREAATKYGIYVLDDIDCKPSKDPSQRQQRA